MNNTLAIVVIIAAVLIGLVALGRTMVWKGDFRLFSRFFLVLGGVVATLLAGFASVLADPLTEWLGLGENSSMYVKLGCFLFVLIAIGWTYDKLRDWWASRKSNQQ